MSKNNAVGLRHDPLYELFKDFFESENEILQAVKEARQTKYMRMYNDEFDSPDDLEIPLDDNYF